MPNTWVIFCPLLNAAFLGVSLRFSDCSASFRRTLRLRICKPHGVAVDTVENAEMLTREKPTLLWTPRQAAEALAISPRKLWQMTKDGEIPHVRMGRSVRYDVVDLHDAVEQKKQRGGAK